MLHTCILYSMAKFTRLKRFFGQIYWILLFTFSFQSQNNDWVSSAFDDFDDFSQGISSQKVQPKLICSRSQDGGRKTAIKRKKTSTSANANSDGIMNNNRKKNATKDNTIVWADKYAPTTLVSVKYLFSYLLVFCHLSF